MLHAVIEEIVQYVRAWSGSLQGGIDKPAGDAARQAARHDTLRCGDLLKPGASMNKGAAQLEEVLVSLHA